MSRTLNLADSLLDMGRKYHQMGRQGDALRILGRLAGMRELPVGVAEEMQVRLAEIHLRCHKPKRARRCLTAALQHQPDSARYHYLMATAWDVEEGGDAERAAQYYRRSLELDSCQTDCLCAYGLLAVRLGQVDEGLRSLQRAVDLASDDPEVLDQLVQGLLLAHRAGEARSALLAARFRHPRDHRFEALWRDFQFQQVRKEQENSCRASNPFSEEDEPILLPFVQPASNTSKGTMGGKILRHDGPTSPAAPHNSHPVRHSDQRHAQ